jgi:hypothetical protein
VAPRRLLENRTQRRLAPLACSTVGAGNECLSDWFPARQRHHIGRESAPLSREVKVLRANIRLQRGRNGGPLTFRRVDEATLYLFWRVHVTGQYLHQCVSLRKISGSRRVTAFRFAARYVGYGTEERVMAFSDWCCRRRFAVRRQHVPPVT